jgi:hypothetical protein
VVALVGLVAGVLIARPGSDGGSEALRVELVPSSEAGEDPFVVGVDALAVEDFTTSEPAASAGAAPAPEGTRLRLEQTSGTARQLYGSSTSAVVCDVASLEAGLAADPEAATAWASLMGVAPDEVGAVLRSLTPLVLGRDALVTNTSYQGGRVRRFPAILQAGTAVLVDRTGTPRVKCSCGNPLLAPPPEVTAADAPVELEGERWEGFSEAEVSLVEPGEAVDELETIDVDTREPQATPTGGTVSLDGYLVLDDDGVHVVSEDGQQRTTVVDQPVSVAHDDGAGGLVFQLATADGEVSLLSAPPSIEAGTIWHLASGAAVPVPVIEPSPDLSLWPILKGAGRFQGGTAVVYGAMGRDPEGGDPCCNAHADLTVRMLETGEETIIDPRAWIAVDTSVARVSVTLERIAWTAYGASPHWNVVDGSLRPGAFACAGPDQAESECIGSGGVLDEDGRLIAFDWYTGREAIVLRDAETNELLGQIDDLRAPALDGIDYWGSLDAHDGWLLLSFRPQRDASPVPALEYRLDGSEPPAVRSTGIVGQVRYLRAPLVRPAGGAVPVTIDVPSSATSTTTTTTAPPPTTAAPERQECGDLAFDPNSGDGAYGIAIVGGTCDEAEALVRQVAAEHEWYGGPPRFASGGFDCESVFVDAEYPSADYTCRSGSTTVTWGR